MISSLAEAEPPVVMTTRRGSSRVLGLLSKSSVESWAELLSLCRNFTKISPAVPWPPIRPPRCWATLTRPPPL